jgi:(p)ppGpp synthase/HD superfamily hydrolase
VDGAPFVWHPLEVAAILRRHGCPEHVVAAGVLHDVLETTDSQRVELEQRFGRRVADLVAALTDDPSIEDVGERRAALRLQIARAGREAAIVFAADKISKVREIGMRSRKGELDDASVSKLEHYRESFEMLEALLPGHPLVARLRRELRAVLAVLAATA